MFDLLETIYFSIPYIQQQFSKVKGLGIGHVIFATSNWHHIKRKEFLNISVPQTKSSTIFAFHILKALFFPTVAHVKIIVE